MLFQNIILRFMNSTIIRIAIASFLLVASFSYAKPRIVQITPLIGQPIVLNSTPIRFSIVFSEPVFGFEKEDILTNGILLALAGREASYTALIIPTQRQLIIDLLVDSVHNINQEGNEILKPPFVWNLDNSPLPPITAFTPRTAAPLYYLEYPPYYGRPLVHLIQVQSVQPPVAPAPQPAPPQPAPPQPEPPPPEPQPTPEPRVESIPSIEAEAPAEKRGLQAKFIFNAGAYNGAPSFFNVEEQTAIEPEQTTEFNTGFELFYRPNVWRRGLGYFATIGYQESSYSSSEPDSSASYTALPLEFGLNLYLSSHFSTSIGGVLHFNGEYKHKGNVGEAFMFEEEVTLEVGDGADSFGAGLPGLILSLNYNYRAFSASLRFISLTLNDYDNIDVLTNPEFLRVPDSSEDINISTLNAIESIGIFFQIRL